MLLLRSNILQQQQARMPSIVYLLFIVWCIVASIHGAEFFPDSEYQALYDFYNATDGINWDCALLNFRPRGVPWQFTTKVNPCDPVWQGLVCAELNGTDHVISLQNYFCLMHGTLPASISALTQLDSLELNDNELAGSLPANITQLQQLTILILSNNEFTGYLPSNWDNCTSLFNLDLYSNQFSGPIPTGLGALTELGSLDLLRNELTGTIPDSLGNLTTLEDLFIGESALSGTIPPAICMLQLVTLFIRDTHIDSGIPNFSENTSFYALDLSYNRLSGTIPDLVGSAGTLGYLDLSSNQLTGPVPAFLGFMENLQTVYLEENDLTGSVPDALFMSQITTLSLGSNLLSGTLPHAAQGPLAFLNLSYNAFHGTVGAVGNYSMLYSLCLQGNQFSGSLQGVFSEQQQYLISVQLDDNQFTGTLPSEIFTLPSLNTLSIVGSCLHGTLPTNICNATNLVALVLYGLTTGQSCRATGGNALAVNRRAFGGSFPTCLLQLPALQTLLLSSNDLTGTVTSAGALSATLLELDLSHNLLTGSIPRAVQNHSWQLLDLSHNKLNGVLHSQMLVNQTLLREQLTDNTQGAGSITYADSFAPTYKLSSNRLSGRIPSSVRSMSVLSVLTGNLFACAYDRSDLPQHDQDVTTYECASNSFDISMYVWVAALSAIAVGALCFWYLRRIPKQVVEFSASLEALFCRFDSVVQLGWIGAAVALAVLMPYYAIVSHFEGTHTHLYAYVLSAIYTSGAVSFALDFVFWAMLMAVVYWVACKIQGAHSVGGAHKNTINLRSLRRVYVLYVLVNMVIVLGVNIAFVYIVLYGSSRAQTVAQLALSVFKTTWNTAVSPYLLRRSSAYCLSEEVSQQESFFTLQLVVALFNNIAIPCLVVMAIDPNCFSEILLPPETSSVSYILPTCDETGAIGGSACGIFSYAFTTITYTPPFTYSYQCSASFVTAYAPAFIYMSLSTVLFDPLMQCALLQWYLRLTPGSNVHKTVSWWMPRLLSPPAPELATRGRTVIGATSTLVTLFTHLGILLSFGVVFPPVALAMAVSMAAVVYVLRYKLQRFLQSVVDAHLEAQYEVAIDVECAKVGSSDDTQRAVQIIICYCCVFYTLFLFDTLGDAQGFRAAVWVLVVVPLAPFVVFGVVFGVKYVHGKHGMGGKSSDGEKGVEMKVVVVDNPLREHV